jgi:hypothetical protein
MAACHGFEYAAIQDGGKCSCGNNFGGSLPGLEFAMVDDRWCANSEGNPEFGTADFSAVYGSSTYFTYEGCFPEFITSEAMCAVAQGLTATDTPTGYGECGPKGNATGYYCGKGVCNGLRTCSTDKGLEVNACPFVSSANKHDLVHGPGKTAGPFTPLSCQYQCAPTYKYFALRNGGECWCGSKLKGSHKFKADKAIAVDIMDPTPFNVQGQHRRVPDKYCEKNGAMFNYGAENAYAVYEVQSHTAMPSFTSSKDGDFNFAKYWSKIDQRNSGQCNGEAHMSEMKEKELEHTVSKQNTEIKSLQHDVKDLTNAILHDVELKTLQ